MVGKLLFRSIRHDGAGILSAALGVAAAVGLLSWHLGLTETAVFSGHDRACRAAAPFQAWIGAPAAGASVQPDEAKVGKDSPVDGAKEAEPALKGRARATAEATQGRRMAFRGRRSAIPQVLIEALGKADVVERVMPLATMSVTMDVRPGGRVLQGPPFSGNVTALPAGGIPFAVGEIEGRLPDDASEVPEVIASTSLFGARVPKPELGATLPFVLANGTLAVKVCGFFEMSNLVPAFPSLYVNKAAMEKITALSGGRPPAVSLVLVQVKAGVDPADVGFVIDGVPEADKCPLYTTDAVADRFRTDSVNNLLSQMPMSLTLAVITSSCLLSTVLMIGLAVRRRRIAELRCAGMTRGGVARLVVAEALTMLIPGWFIGFAVSSALLQLYLWSEKASGELPHLIHLGWQTPVFSALLALVVGLFAVIAPVVSSLRVKPLEAVGGDITAVRPVTWGKTVAAVLLLLPLPLIAMDFALANGTKSMLMVCVGIPCFIASLCLGMHPLMRLVEKLFLRPIGLLLGLDPVILERRISRDPARAAGTVLTLALGLGGFIAVHIWGGTLMSSFVPNPEWPDAIISVLPSGFTDAQVEAVRSCAGVADGRALKVECTQLPVELVKTSGKDVPPSVNDVVLLFGTDAEEAFGGDRPLAPFTFIEGERKAAAALLKGGDFCVITKMFSNLTDLHKGDAFRVEGRVVEVAGVVDLNWHMVTSRANVRTRFGGKNTPRGRGAGGGRVRTAGMAFVGEQFVRELTGNTDRTYFLWLNMSGELRNINALQAAVRLDEEVRVAVGDDGSSAIRVHHRDEISDGTLAHGSDILGAMARIPFWSLVVTSTGIAVLLIASVRGSKREFEVMRAIGMTRSQLARLILGEALLVTLCALVLSLLSGILVGWSFTGLSSWLMSSGLDVKLVVPWATVGKGIAFAVGLCLIMVALPLARLVREVDS